jgi:glycosidase
MEDLSQLLTEVHLRKMRLILDFVPNHTSDCHPWFLEAKSSRWGRVGAGEGEGRKKQERKTCINSGNFELERWYYDLTCTNTARFCTRDLFSGQNGLF